MMRAGASSRILDMIGSVADWKRGTRLGQADHPGPPRLRRGKRLEVPTMIAYLRAFLRFYVWCVAVGWAARIPDLRALEAALVEWMEELHGVGPYVGIAHSVRSS